MSNKGFVYLDFRNKVVYFANEKRDLMDSVPATIAEREAFITHFYSKGIKECTFKQLKQYVNFHGTRKQGRVYATIQITDEHLYLKLMRKNEKNLQSAIDDFVRESFGRKKDNEIKKFAMIVAKHTAIVYADTYKKEIEKQFEKFFDD